MNHLIEWQQSCVDEQLTRLNVVSLEGTRAMDFLLYSDALPRRNDGRVSTSILERYEHTEQGGWWCSGIDILTGEEDLWGCFKPDEPRLTNDQKKIIKYEHPPKTSTGIFALKVPLHIWEKIARRYQVDIEINPQQPDSGFWQWLINHPQIPVCITEGAKKAGALLSAGYAAIALPGIYNGYRTPKDEAGNRIGKTHLIPQIEKLATPNRDIYIVFDQDTKPNTTKAVEAAIKKMGYLLHQKESQVKVITWNPQLGKGVDDLIMNCGEAHFEQIYQKALSLDIWKAQSLNRLTYTPHIEINSPYLPHNLSIPSHAKLIGIKSPKGTGKTYLLETIVKEALEAKKPILVIGHRIRLVEALCQRFGLKYITEIKDDSKAHCLGYGLCIDSLHSNSQAHFNPLKWSNALVIIDEVEQVLWHGLNSDTCKNQRVEILKSFKALMENVLGGKSQVFVADADLSDISLNYLISLAGIHLEPYIIHNSWIPKPQETWPAYSYIDGTPKRLVKDLEKHIREGGKPFVCLSAQKLTSQWGTLTLEAYFRKKFPHLKILRIDSESLVEANHPAKSCLTNLQLLENYDLVIASPCIETGLSIEIQNHFTSVWAIAQGVQTVNSVCQALGRIRSHIPRYIWAASYGFNQVGNGSTSLPALLTPSHRLTQIHISLLQQADFANMEDIDTNFQPESLLCWANMAVRINAGMIHYRESILALLQEEGHQIYEPPIGITSKRKTQEQNSLTQQIASVRDENYQQECIAITNSPQINQFEYNRLQRLVYKNSTQKRIITKFELQRRYSIPITEQLVAKDDQGWYKKLRLHYFLTVGRSYLKERDNRVLQKLLASGKGSLFIPDFNNSQLGATIGTLELLGIPKLISTPDRELRNTDEDLQKLADMVLKNRTEIKTIMKIGIHKSYSPITILGRFLHLIDYKLDCIRCEKVATKRLRVYRIIPSVDQREEIFQQWLMIDINKLEASEVYLEEETKSDDESEIEESYTQLSLFA